MHIQHQVRQAVNLAPKLPGPQGRRVIFARHFPHMSAQQLTGEEGAEARLQVAAGPQEEFLAQYPAAPEVNRAGAGQAAAPGRQAWRRWFGRRRARPRPGRTSRPRDHALGADGLVAAQGALFEQRGTVTAIAQLVEAHSPATPPPMIAMSMCSVCPPMAPAPEFKGPVYRTCKQAWPVRAK